MKPWSILFFIIASLLFLTVAVAWRNDTSSLRVETCPVPAKAVAACKKA